jgi:hypothetical protein
MASRCDAVAVVHLLEAALGRGERSRKQADVQPAEASLWMNRERPPSSGSSASRCSPSTSPGRNRRQSQRSSRAGSAARTVGLKVIARAGRLDMDLEP